MTLSIRKTFANKSIFLTGGTGFLGKVLLEKILFSLPEVKNIFLLIRPLQGMNPQQRMEMTLRDPLFDRLHLKYSRSEYRDKIVLVEGDIMHEQLGISRDVRRMICDNVNIVIHSAAMVKFHRPLWEAVEPNFFGTRRVTQLCKEIKHLNSFVHISTAFANGHLADVEEKVYPVPFSPLLFAESLLGMSIEEQNKIAQAVIGRRPNTYAFAKAITEIQLQEDVGQGEIPVTIVRPAAIGPTHKWPLPGWCDSVNSTIGLSLSIGQGVTKCLPGDGNVCSNLIPVDMTANVILAAAANRAVSSKNGIDVVHCTTHNLSWKQISDYVVAEFRENPPRKSFGKPRVDWCGSESAFKRNFFVLYILPAYVVDAMNVIIGKEANSVKAAKKLWWTLCIWRFFITTPLNFKTDNMERLWNELNEEEKKEFDFNSLKIDWKEYMKNYVYGIKKFVLRETPAINSEPELPTPRNSSQRDGQETKLHTFRAIHYQTESY